MGDQPGNDRGQKGPAAYRISGLGERGQIDRLATESIFVYCKPSTGSLSSGMNTGTTKPSKVPDVGTPLKSLADLVGSRSGQAEAMIKQLCDHPHRQRA